MVETNRAEELMSRPGLMKKIRAMLQRTVDRGFTEAEAAEAASKVREILDRYNLDVAALPKEEGTPRFTVHKKMHSKIRNQFPLWQLNIAQGIAKYYNCGVLIMRSGPVWLGTEEDIEVCAEMFEWILSQMDILKSSAIIQYEATHFKMSGGEKLRFAHSWRRGAAGRLYWRLDGLAKKRTATNQEECTALVVIDKEKLELVDKLKAGMKINKVYYSKEDREIRNGIAFQKGQQDAEKVSVNRLIN